MPNVLNEFAGDGVTRTFNFSMTGGYLSRDYVYFFTRPNDDLLNYTPYNDDDVTWLTDFSVRTANPIPVGTTFVILRSTTLDPLVDFQNTSRITEKNLDTATWQSVHIAAETSDTVSRIRVVAAASKQEAADAALNAQLAADSAINAAASATAASQSAGVAVSTANTAMFVATEAKELIDQAVSGAVVSFNGRAGVVTPQAGDYTKAMVGLGNVANTADSDKPVSIAQQSALNTKVDKAAGQRLMTDAEGTKIAGIAEQATKNATDAALRDRSTHTGTQTASTIASFSAEVRAAYPNYTQTGVDLKTIKSTGLYPVVNSLDVPQGSVGFLEVFAYSTAWVVHRYYALEYPALSWRRNFTNGNTWSPWILETNQLNAAIPIASGGIIERGSNANGTYTKFADGTLICIGSATIPAAAANTGISATWTLPTAFVDGTYALQHSTSSVIGSGSIESSGNIVANGVTVYKQSTTCSLYIYTYKLPITDQVVFSLTAIGRWK